MKKRKSIIVLGLFLLSGCSFLYSPVSSSTNSSAFSGEIKEYNISIISNAKKKLNNVAVELYKDNKRVRSLLTDENGTVNFSLSEDNYEIEFKNVPDGYYIEKNPRIEIGTYNYDFVFYSKVIEKDAPKDTVYNLGDIIYDFSVNDCEGKTFSLSESLKTHDAVLINFWNTNCLWCAEEFPIMEEVYQEYGDKIEYIALSNFDTDNDILQWKNQLGLSFPMAYDSNLLWNMFGVAEFPTTIMIDRYGIISYGQSGAFTSKEEMVDLLTQFIGDNYEPYISKDFDEDEKRIPNVSMPSSSEIEAIINGEGVNCTYRINEDENDPGFKWPWIISDDKKSIKASNSKINNTASSIETDIVIPKGQALAFDYLASTEKDYDVLYVFVDGVAIHQISGNESSWKTCFAYVSNETRSYNIHLFYYKDYDGYAGEDTVYINNMRFVSEEEINIPTYISRFCSEGFIESTWNYNKYVNVVYNNEDGFYHVDTINGPLVLADLIYETNWSDTLTPYNIAAGNGAIVNDIDYTETILEYVRYAGNGSITYTPVTEELHEALVAVTNKYGDPNNGNEWLELCMYYSAYGTDQEYQDPTKGLATFNAYNATLGDQNFVTFDRPILPRGLKFKFVPETSGVYKVNSIGEEETVCWIMDENGNIIAENNFYARKFKDESVNIANFEMYYYFEAGETYFINPAFYDYLYEGTLQFNLEYVGESYSLFTLCSPGFYTTGLDEFGNMTDEIISPGISYKLCDDGYYYEVREDGTTGSLIYVDFIYANFINMSLTEAIKYDGFKFGNEDLSLKIRQYIAKAEQDETKETYGCLPVNEELKSILEKFMNKYGFEGVEHQWLKLCYYYQYFGA